MTDQASTMRHNEQSVDVTHHAHHIVPVRVYVGIIIILMVLTYLTVKVAYVNLGGLWNLVVALGLATAKATIVALWFMHVRYSGKLVQLTIVTALLFLMLMIFGVLMDVWTRHNVTPAGYIMTPEYEKEANVKLPHGDDHVVP